MEERTTDHKYLSDWALEHVWTPLRSWQELTGPDGFNIFIEGKGC